MVIDPVCNKEVDENAPLGGKVNFWGKVFYFCSEECRRTFRRRPQDYAPEIAAGRGPEYDKSKTNESWRV